MPKKHLSLIFSINFHKPRNGPTHIGGHSRNILKGREQSRQQSLQHVLAHHDALARVTDAANRPGGGVLDGQLKKMEELFNI
jgi:hypothetical protein